MERELTFNDILVCFKKNFWKILVFALIAALLMGGFTHFLVNKKYSSEIKFYVINSNEKDDFSQAAILNASSYLVKDYIDIINGDDIINEACKRLEEMGYSNITPEMLRKKISSSVSQNSSFTLKITDTDPERAYDIASIIAEISPTMLTEITKPTQRTASVPVTTSLNEIAKIIEKDYPQHAEAIKKASADLKEDQSSATITATLDNKPAVKVILEPNLAKEHDSPNLILNCLVAAFVGAFISFAYFVVRSLLNTRICTEEDVAKYLSKYPLIGTVPSWDINEKSGPKKTDYRLNR